MIHGVTQIPHCTLCSHTLLISWTFVINSDVSVNDGSLELLVNIVQDEEIVFILGRVVAVVLSMGARGRAGHSAEVFRSLERAGV